MKLVTTRTIVLEMTTDLSNYEVETSAEAIAYEKSLTIEEVLEYVEVSNVLRFEIEVREVQ